MHGVSYFSVLIFPLSINELHPFYESAQQAGMHGVAENEYLAKRLGWLRLELAFGGVLRGFVPSILPSFRCWHIPQQYPQACTPIFVWLDLYDMQKMSLASYLYNQR